jgi:hypothetical protein
MVLEVSAEQNECEGGSKHFTSECLSKIAPALMVCGFMLEFVTMPLVSGQNSSLRLVQETNAIDPSQLVLPTIFSML